MFIPKNSTVYFLYLICVHVFAVACLLMLTFGLIFALLLLLGEFLWFMQNLHEKKILSLRYDQKTEWILQLSSTEFERAHLLGSSVMFSCGMILHFKLINGSTRKTICVFSDSFSRVDFQHLRRCVRMNDGFA